MTKINWHKRSGIKSHMKRRVFRQTEKESIFFCRCNEKIYWDRDEWLKTKKRRRRKWIFHQQKGESTEGNLKLHMQPNFYGNSKSLTRKLGLCRVMHIAHKNLVKHLLPNTSGSFDEKLRKKYSEIQSFLCREESSGQQQQGDAQRDLIAKP